MAVKAPPEEELSPKVTEVGKGRTSLILRAKPEGSPQTKSVGL